MSKSVSEVKEIQKKTLEILNKTFRYYGFNQSTWFEYLSKKEDGYEVLTYIEFAKPKDEQISNLEKLLEKADDKPNEGRIVRGNCFIGRVYKGREISEKEAILLKIESLNKEKDIERYKLKVEQGLLHTDKKKYKTIDNGYNPFNRMVKLMDSRILKIHELLRINKASEIIKDVINPELKYLKKEYTQMSFYEISENRDLCILEAKIHIYEILINYLKSK
jgi:hypothetical protein